MAGILSEIKLKIVNLYFIAKLDSEVLDLVYSLYLPSSITCGTTPLS